MKSTVNQMTEMKKYIFINKPRTQGCRVKVLRVWSPRVLIQAQGRSWES